MQKYLAEKPRSGYTLAMQIDRQLTATEYSCRNFRLHNIKGVEKKRNSVFTLWVTEATCVAVLINRDDAARILRKVRREEKQLSA